MEIYKARIFDDEDVDIFEDHFEERRQNRIEMLIMVFNSSNKNYISLLKGKK